MKFYNDEKYIKMEVSSDYNDEIEMFEISHKDVREFFELIFVWHPMGSLNKNKNR